MAKQMEVNGKVGNDKPIELSEIGKEPVLELAGEKVSPKDLDLVSIHAPVRGATNSFVDVFRPFAFQSTRP